MKILTSLKHENLVRFRGFCCSKSRGECFLVYDFASHGNLLQYLDLQKGDTKILEWSTRVSIIYGIARGQFIYFLFNDTHILNLESDSSSYHVLLSSFFLFLED